MQMLGDNIYHKDENGEWIQEDSHHSNDDGTVNTYNLNRDTGTTDQVLVSFNFLYFGEGAVEIDLDSVDYGRIRDFRKINMKGNPKAGLLMDSVKKKSHGLENYIFSDPCQYKYSYKRADQESGRII